MVRSTCRPWALVLFLLLPAASAAQQGVRGSVVEGGSGVPVAGAMVVLLAGDSTVARVLTGADGTFRMAVPRAGRFELRVDRLGYTSTYSEPFDLAAGATLVRTIETQVDAIVLPGLSVEGSGRCELAAEAGAATATLWEEARKALEAATWTSERGFYRFGWTRYVRDLEADGRTVIGEERSVRAERLAQPFTSVDPEILLREGFLYDRGAAGLAYAAPDAAVLLSDGFLDTHCLAFERGQERDEALVGLRFEPVRGRDVPEVEGVLWFAAETGRLRRVEYRYVNLPWRVADGRAEGELGFQALPNGTWIVDEWEIRMPRLAEVRDRAGRVEGHEILGFKVEGSAVSVVETTTGEVVSRSAATGTLRGRVSDSLGRPLEGARVWIAGTAFSALTGGDGSFAFGDLGEGIWSVGASLPALDRVGYPGAFAPVEVVRGATAVLDLALPSVLDAALALCGDAGAGPPTALVGRVVDAAGLPIPGAEVRATWIARVGPGGVAEEGVGLRADADGRFVVCGFPPSRPVRTRATVDGIESQAVVASVAGAGGVEFVRVEVAETAAPPTPVIDEGTALSGEEAAWLASKGFRLRAADALLHQTRPEIPGRAITTVERLLTQAPRVEARHLASGGVEFRLHATGGWRADPGASPSCPIETYLNGSLVQANRPALAGDAADPARRSGDAFLPLDLDRWLRPSEISAVELFSGGEAPVEVPGGCAAALFWVHRLEHADDPDFTGALRGRVQRLSDGAPVAGVPVRVEPGGLEVTTDAFGRFDLGWLPPARYRIEATVPGWGLFTTEVLLRAGSLADVGVQVEPGGTAAGGGR